ncbi:hypothetical protein DFH29DRAFT_882724 [Suillus ampliporus]|nr:hypothetical protein DFH29DRAFT_882724 [Suillus ampliporus]
MALTGKDSATNVQYAIEPIRNSFQGPREVSVVRDYDSIICFTDWLPINANLYIYPVTNPFDTLQANIHFKVPMKINAGMPPVNVAPNRVPNICLGAIGIRTKMRLFFPRLYTPEGNVVELAYLYVATVYTPADVPVHLLPFKEIIYVTVPPSPRLLFPISVFSVLGPRATSSFGYSRVRHFPTVPPSSSPFGWTHHATVPPSPRPLLLLAK